MASLKKIPKSVKFLESDDFFKLFEEFIRDTYKGRRMRKDGQSIRSSSMDTYTATIRLLRRFAEHKGFAIRLPLVQHLNQVETHKAAKYWMEFYQQFKNYLYDEEGHFDNYVGCTFKNLKTFLNYLNDDRLIQVGLFHRKFHVPSEDIPIVVLTPQQLKYLIHDRELDKKLSEDLSIARDIFVVGSTVALRYSDLMNLKPFNLEKKAGGVYLTVHSQKTGTKTSVLLPDYVLSILEKYKGKQKTLLPVYTKAHLNKQLKRLGAHVMDGGEMIKTRMRRGKQVVIYKDKAKKLHYTLADHITSHTMRRTAITTMLLLGMPEAYVRMISGHSKSSKEFYKYVEYTQHILDAESQKIYKQLGELSA
jgi:integrase